jgi:hypothetical protein
MKIRILSLLFSGMMCNVLYAQNGLEGIVVERYYKSTAADTAANSDGGRLPVGSVTYRIFADLLPGYRFQAAYGVPGHELRIQTTTLFFNNEDRGDVTPSYTKTQAKSNTVMLDSWLSVGAACAGNFGVLKVHDIDSIATVVNNYSPQVLQGSDPTCGIPVRVQDGLVSGTPGSMTVVGLNTEIAVFGSQNDGTNGPVFSSTNGSWACLGGSVGADSMMNHVLIAQITTDGQFSFKLNIQIGTPSGGVENYVAENPVGNEIQIPSLIYSSTIDSTASIAMLTTADSRMLVYPNPGNGNFTLAFEGFQAEAEPVVLSLFSLQGLLVNSQSFTVISGNKVNAEYGTDLAPGIYLLEARIREKTMKAKLIVR